MQLPITSTLYSKLPIVTSSIIVRAFSGRIMEYVCPLYNAISPKSALRTLSSSDDIVKLPVLAITPSPSFITTSESGLIENGEDRLKSIVFILLKISPCLIL